MKDENVLPLSIGKVHYIESGKTHTNKPCWFFILEMVKTEFKYVLERTEKYLSIDVSPTAVQINKCICKSLMKPLFGRHQKRALHEH